MGKSELNVGFLHKSMLDAFLEMCKRTGMLEYFKRHFTRTSSRLKITSIRWSWLKKTVNL